MTGLVTHVREQPCELTAALATSEHVAVQQFTRSAGKTVFEQHIKAALSIWVMILYLLQLNKMSAMQMTGPDVDWMLCE